MDEKFVNILVIAKAHRLPVPKRSTLETGTDSEVKSGEVQGSTPLIVVKFARIEYKQFILKRAADAKNF